MPITLKAARVNRGIKQGDAAKALGVNPDTLCNWEKGLTFPTVPQIKKIEELYGVSYADINFLLTSSV